MEIEKYIECYEFCLKQGWVHNTPIIDVCIDYFDSEKGRKKLFENHLEKILEHQIKRKIKKIHILIGEAPPYYPNDKFPEDPKRRYFYDPNHSPATHYFRQPYEYFVEDIQKFDPKEKQNYLDELAKKGVLILDIFPFPVIQSTDIRDNIKRCQTEEEKSHFASCFESINSEDYFACYLNRFFEPRLEELFRKFDKFQDVIIKIYLFAPKYTSVQFLHWIWVHKKKCIDNLIKFKGNKNFKPANDTEWEGFLNGKLKDFIKRLVGKDIDDFCTTIKDHPIFMNGSGNPDFEQFVNGQKKANNGMASGSTSPKAQNKSATAQRKPS
jgi:hypothetical protein